MISSSLLQGFLDEELTTHHTRIFRHFGFVTEEYCTGGGIDVLLFRTFGI